MGQAGADRSQHVTKGRDAFGAASGQGRLYPSRIECLSRVPENLGTLGSNLQFKTILGSLWSLP